MSQGQWKSACFCQPLFKLEDNFCNGGGFFCCVITVVPIPSPRPIALPCPAYPPTPTVNPHPVVHVHGSFIRMVGFWCLRNSRSFLSLRLYFYKEKEKWFKLNFLNSCWINEDSVVLGWVKNEYNRKIK